MLPEKLSFEIPRKKGQRFSVIREIERVISLEKLELVGLTYSMGDAINKITSIQRVKNRGVLPGKAGEATGVGRRVYDEIASSGLRAVVIPGLHRNVAALDPRFRALYSHCASAEKVSLCYHAYLRTRAENLIVSDVSSNTVTIGIKDGRFLGAVDACLGAPGLFHGPLDLEALRSVDAGLLKANEAFSRGGVTKISGAEDAKRVLKPKDERDKLALEALVMSVLMEIYGFLSLLTPEAIVITGWAGVSSSVYERLRASLEDVAPVHRLNGYAAAKGSAEIARDIIAGKKDFLGILVDL